MILFVQNSEITICKYGKQVNPGDIESWGCVMYTMADWSLPPLNRELQLVVAS